MSGIGTGYDLSGTTYSPDGRVFQAEYACKAVDNAGTTIGVKCKDGVLIAVEKQVESKMVVPGSASSRRVMACDRHAGIACAGLAPDGRQLVNRARAECANYKSFYGDAIPGQVLADRMASYMHLHTLYWHVRPYGATAIMAAFDSTGNAGGEGDEADGGKPLLFVIEPTGVCHSYKAAACGKGRQGVRTDLERLDLATLTCEDAMLEVAKLIVKAKDDSSKRETEVEMAIISRGTGKQFKRVEDDVVKKTMEDAKEAIDAEMDDD